MFYLYTLFFYRFTFNIQGDEKLVDPYVLFQFCGEEVQHTLTVNSRSIGDQ